MQILIRMFFNLHSGWKLYIIGVILVCTTILLEFGFLSSMLFAGIFMIVGAFFAALSGID